jgi:hypothetical protein
MAWLPERESRPSTSSQKERPTACFMNFCARGIVFFREDRPRVQQVRFPFFADLVALAGGLNPIPSRTRPLNSPAPMVLSLKAWKSRSLPGLPRTENILDTMTDTKSPPRKRGGFFLFVLGAGRSRAFCGDPICANVAARVSPRDGIACSVPSSGVRAAGRSEMPSR